MNKLTPVTVYVPVSVEEIPDKDGWYTLVVDGGINVLEWYDSENGWCIEKSHYAYKHWLKPLPYQYIFSRSEFMDLLELLFEAGYNKGFQVGAEIDMPEVLGKESYIKQLGL